MPPRYDHFNPDSAKIKNNRRLEDVVAELAGAKKYHDTTLRDANRRLEDLNLEKERQVLFFRSTASSIFLEVVT